MMAQGHSQEYTKQEVITLLNRAMGRTFEELTGQAYFDRMPDDFMDKGLPGKIVEQYILGCGTNTDQAPDIIIDGARTEVKATGFTIDKNGHRAKEFISVTAVSVNDIVNQEFFDSYFWHKIEHLLLVYYQYREKPPCKSKKYRSFPFCGYEFFSFPESDLREIIREWTLVRDKVREMSQRENPREHYPNIRRELGDELAMLGIAPKYPPRFRLKQGVVTTIIRRHFEHAAMETLPHTIDRFADLDAECHRITERFRGRTVRDLLGYFGITDYNPRNKALLRPLIIRMFGGTGSRYENVDQFSKLGIIVKSICLSSNHHIKEQMKLFPVNFKELMEDKDFEESELYAYFADHQFLFPMFAYTDTDSMLDCVFMGFKRMGFDEDFITDHVQRLWADTRSLISENRLARTTVYLSLGTPKMTRVTRMPVTSLNFPRASEYYVYIKLGGTNGAAYTEVVNGIEMVQQWYWINTFRLFRDLDRIDYL